MPELNDIVGQDEAVGRLQGMLAADRVPHAYLFAGPEGVGRQTTATALAKTLLCPQPAEAVAEGGPVRRACGECRDCRMVDGGTHPDLHVVYKELARYHDDSRVRERKLQALGIEVVRSFVIAPANQAPSRGRGKVLIVLEAELMSPEAQNALLKTLEEPPAGVTIILLSTRPDQLLLTTLSRCSLVRFGPLPRPFVVDKLTAAGLEAGEADFWARFTHGSIGRSLRLAEAGLYEVKRDVLQRLAEVPPAGDAELGEQICKTAEKLADEAIKASRRADGTEMAVQLARRRSTGPMLELIASAYQDAMHLATEACDADDLPVHVDQAEVVQALACRFTPEQLAGILEQLSQCEALLWRNVNPRLVWDNAVITCASAGPLRVGAE